MKKTILASVAATILLSLSSAFAMADEPQTESIQVAGRADYKLAPMEFSVYGQAYRLDTGETLQLRQQVNRYFSRIKGKPEVELHGQAPGVFISASGTKFVFSDEGEQVAITGLERMPGALATNNPDSVHYASR